MRGTSRLLLHNIHIIPDFHRDIMFISKVSLRNTPIFFTFIAFMFGIKCVFIYGKVYGKDFYLRVQVAGLS